MGIGMVDMDGIISDISHGTVVGDSDGSFKEEFGTISWVIGDTKGT